MDEPILQFFAFAHLPSALQQISKPFCDLANHVVETLPRNPERTVALRGGPGIDLQGLSFAAAGKEPARKCEVVGVTVGPLGCL